MGSETGQRGLETPPVIAPFPLVGGLFPKSFSPFVRVSARGGSAFGGRGGRTQFKHDLPSLTLPYKGRG